MFKSIDLPRVDATPLAKVAARQASEICARLDLTHEGRAGLLPTLSPQGFLAVLMNGGHFSDAVRVLAFALPAREGVWWACVVAEAMPPSSAQDDCLDCARTWVYEGGDDNRRRCLAAAEAVQFQGAAAYASLAAFWSGGSLAPPGNPDVPPHRDLVHIGVAASLLLAVAAGDPLAATATFGEVLGRGLDIARGGNGRLAGDRPRAAAGAVT